MIIRNLFQKSYLFLKNLITFKIHNFILSRFIYLIFISILLTLSFYSYQQEKNQIRLKYDYWGQRIGARNNKDGVFTFYLKENPFISQLWNHLQKKNFSYTEQKLFLEKRKKDSEQKFHQDFVNFNNWIIENKWPRLKKVIEEMLPIINDRATLTKENLKTTIHEKLLSMEEITAKSTLDASIKATLFIHFRSLRQALDDYIKTDALDIKNIKTLSLESVKKDFHDIYLNILSDYIESQDEIIMQWNRLKKQSFYTLMFLTFILFLRFSYLLYTHFRKKNIQFSKIKTSQLIIDLLYELEEIGLWLSERDMFKIEQEKEDGFLEVKYTVGGLELDKKTLHFEHLLRCGKKKSLFDIFSELKARSVKFNCCNYYKEDDEPHSFTISLKIKISR